MCRRLFVEKDLNNPCTPVHGIFAFLQSLTGQLISECHWYKPETLHKSPLGLGRLLKFCSRLFQFGRLVDDSAEVAAGLVG